LNSTKENIHFSQIERKQLIANKRQFIRRDCNGSIAFVNSRCCNFIYILFALFCFCPTIIYVDTSHDINFSFLHCWSYSSIVSVYVYFTSSLCIRRYQDFWQRTKEFLLSNNGGYQEEHFEQSMRLFEMNFLAKKFQLDKQSIG
jgi:hypothetical protein